MSMNLWHRVLCSSATWEWVSGTHIVPWALAGTGLPGRTLEIGPGYGANVTAMRRHTADLTGLEIDPALADRLRARLPGQLRVVTGDGTAMPLPDDTFGSVVCFTMLHHVPTPDQQDALFTEAWRVLAPGGTFAGADGLDTRLFRLQHLGDTCVPVPPETLTARLTAIGFTDIEVTAGRALFRFRARRPLD